MNGHLPPFDALIEAYASAFYGYGSPDAPLWFIGLEEGGGESLDGVERQVGCWDRRGRPEVDDLSEMQSCMGLSKWRHARPPLQTTWAQLIRVVLVATGRPADVESVRRYQATELGRRSGQNRLTELLPLPSQSTRDWRYAEWTSLPWLRTRAAYVQDIAPMRADRIREEIAVHRPAVVMMYGLATFAYEKWKSIAGVALSPIAGVSGRLEIGDNNAGTVYLVSPHPAARVVTPQFFLEVGKVLRGRLE